MAHPTLQYLTREYFEHNPTWDLADTPWKARIVAAALTRNGIQPSSVCEVGCGSGGCLAELRTIYPEAELSGFDIAPDAAAFWLQYDGLNIHFEVGDALRESSLKCDVLLMLDVVEHLADPHDFLERLLGKANFYIFHIPLDLSAFSVYREAPLLYVRNKVGHIHYFTKELALSLLRECGYEIVDAAYTQAAFTAPSHGWKTLIAKPLRRIIYALFGKDRGVRLIGGETLIVVAQKR
ncbi:class I SAM-dependent methyltransferase [Thiovibrio frasassiensis]|uniref:Class I SAM-dependent methyltransferase n=1 Tax=Thiovibrio frasassiensis TaxID=2984131 RepID=A0A9X4MJK3_9BACT|nr:methyltransferase domain-containing protein [Thiovibrio frasassiensis]MDG4476044.1 class I SAM-dependent methyltransferase [Thiovibrio frasassiensis]